MGPALRERGVAWIITIAVDSRLAGMVVGRVHSLAARIVAPGDVRRLNYCDRGEAWPCSKFRLNHAENGVGRT